MNTYQKIRNADTLTAHGETAARAILLQVMDRVLCAVDAGAFIRSIMRLDGDTLTIGTRSWDLSTKRHIYLLGAGKACNHMAMAVCDVLGERITRGIISVKIAEEQDRYVNTTVYVGGHPLPNEAGEQAALAMLELIEQASEQDLFISVISGGSSALLTCPIEGITLQEEIVAQDLLLKTGAKILEINAVRRHISRTNGGRLAQAIRARGAELINFLVSDSVGRLPAVDPSTPEVYYGTPVAADASTIEQAREMMRNYFLLDKLPKSIVDYLMDDDRVQETPKDFPEGVTSYVTNVVSDSCDAAQRIAQEMGLPCMILSTYFEGESKDAGHVLSSIAREIKQWRRPIAPPCLLVCAGETTTAIDTPPQGMGGPSHELCMGFAIGSRDWSGLVAASIDTEGTDGTTPYAGALVDGLSYARLEQAGINPFEALRGHSCGNAFEAIGDNIFTGNTGTNLCDLNLLYIHE